MRKLPLSQRMRKEIEEILKGVPEDLDNREKNTEVLEKLALEMYVRGLSTRDIEDALFEATGNVFLSKASVSRITEELNLEYENFQKRDLSVYEVEYLFLDAI